MDKNANKQKTQFIVLGVLSAVLVLILVYNFLLKPVLDDCSELKDEIEANDMLKWSQMEEISFIPTYEEEIGQAKVALEERTAKLYEPMNSEDADIILLKRLTDSGLKALTLSVTSAVPLSELQPDEKYAPDSVETGVSVITASYEAEGSYSQLLSFIGLINSDPAVSVVSIEYSAAEEKKSSLVVGNGGFVNVAENNEVSEQQLTITVALDVYMFSPPVMPEPDTVDDIEGAYGFADSGAYSF